MQGTVTTLRVAGIQFGSRHAPQREAQRQAAQLPDAPALHLYGVGLGDLPRHLLQSRPRLQCLEIHLLNVALFARLLALADHLDWLQDPRVRLSLAGDEDDVSAPFFAHPGELALVDDTAARMRDRLIAELTLPLIRRTFRADHPLLMQRLSQNRVLLAEDHDVAELLGTASGRAAFIIGSGPTLKQHLNLLARLAARAERPLLVAADTALAPLAHAGIRPDIAVACD